MQQCWPMLTKVVERFGTDPVVAENVCRCYKHSMRNCKEEFTPLLEPVMQQLVAAFDYSFRSSYLYAASICITEFSNNPTYSPRLFEMIVSLSTSVFKRFVNIEAFTSNPDVVEEVRMRKERFYTTLCSLPTNETPTLSPCSSSISFHVSSSTAPTHSSRGATSSAKPSSAPWSDCRCTTGRPTRGC